MNPWFTRSLSRRAMLRGTAAAVALPWLEAMAPRSALASSSPGPLPIRLGFVYVPNGMDMDGWTPRREGADFEITPVLRPIADFRDSLLVISGMTSDPGRPHGDSGNHAPAMGAFLTGVHPRKTEVRLGVSADQIAAEHFAPHTRLPSLNIGSVPVRWSCDGFPCICTSTMSWRSATQPVPKEVSPRAVFDRLFSAEVSTRRTQTRRSILDTVRGEAVLLQQRLGAVDRRKLDEYLSSVRDIEQRIERAESFPPPRVPGAAARPDARVPANYDDQLQLMGDLMVLAYQTDSTRVCTFIYDHEQSSRSYNAIGVSGGHHDLSHHGGRAEVIEKIATINRFHLTHFARVLRQLQDIREGDGTLLDRCLIAYGSSLGDGNRHDHHDLPIVVFGKGGGRVRSGRHLRFPTETPITNLWLTLLERAGVRADRLGDSTGTLRGLDA